MVLHALTLHKHAPDHHAWLDFRHQKRSGSVGVLAVIPNGREVDTLPAPPALPP